MSIEKFSGVLNNHVKDGFTTILTRVIHLLGDLEAIGLYTYLASLPPGWNINVKHLRSALNIGRNKVYELLNILIDKRLLERKEIKDRGKFIKHEYNLYISPLPEKRDVVEAFSPLPGLPEAVNGDTYKIYNIENKELYDLDHPKVDRLSSDKRDHPKVDRLVEKRFSTDTDIVDNSQSELKLDDWKIGAGDQYQNLDPESKRGNKQYIVHFERFWEIYPKKVNKKGCEAKWKSLKLDSKIDLIIDKLKKQCLSKQWIEGFIPNPLTYLNQERWEDETPEDYTKTISQKTIDTCTIPWI
jgi:hypothetical protein